MAKPTSRFFTVKPTRGGTMLFLRGKQIGSIYKDDDGFFACTKLDAPRGLSKMFPTFAAADEWIWLNYA